MLVQQWDEWSVLGVAAELDMCVHTPRVLVALAAVWMGVIIF